jgi:hypothetical protein
MASMVATPMVMGFLVYEVLINAYSSIQNLAWGNGPVLAKSSKKGSSRVSGWVSICALFLTCFVPYADIPAGTRTSWAWIGKIKTRQHMTSVKIFNSFFLIIH